MIPLRSEKQVRLYGQLLVNFANARNSDEAYEELIKGVQRAFNFSTNFVKQSEKILPSLRELRSTFSKKENVLINLILIERNIKHNLNDQFGLINRKLTDYNSEKNTLKTYHGGEVRPENEQYSLVEEILMALPKT